MVFSSMTFLFAYLPVTLALYYLCPLRARNLLLLVANLIFYGWGEPKYIVIMFASILIDYIHGALIDKYRANDRLARCFVASSVVLNLALLFFFKYWDFFAAQLGLPVLGVPLPLGISFYTFQTMSYSIDVYRGEAERQKSLLKFGVFVTLFPQLIAGPIVRYREIARELTDGVHPRVRDFSEGALLFTVGLSKKVLLANNIGKLWETLQASPDLTVAGAWMGALAFSFQIYFDFSGYSDMACGLGRMLGFHFPENFRHPYIARSVTDFWRRWHITLGSWFREYVYIPLGGNRLGIRRQLFNIAVVWFLTGFWHGANWNFIFWGVYYCILLMIEKLWLLPHLKKGRVWPHIYTMVLVIIGWALFVGSDYGVSLGLLLQKMFVPSGGASALYYLRNYGVLLAVSILACTPVTTKIYAFLKRHVAVRGLVLAVVFLITVAYMVDATNSPFLYFRF